MGNFNPNVNEMSPRTVERICDRLDIAGGKRQHTTPARYNNERDGRIFVSVAAMHLNQVHLLDTANYEVVTVLPTFKLQIRLIEFAPWNENLIAVACKHEVHLWDIDVANDGSSLRGTLNHKVNVPLLRMNFGKSDGDPVDEFLITRSGEQTLYKWNTSSNELMFSILLKSYAADICVCWYGRIIVTAVLKDARIHFYNWNTRNGEDGTLLESSFETAISEANLTFTNICVRGCQGNGSMLSMVTHEHTVVTFNLLSENEVSLSTWESPLGTDLTGNNIFSGDGRKLFLLDFISDVMFVLDPHSMTLISQFSFRSDTDLPFRVNFAGDQIFYHIYDDDNERVTGSWNVWDIDSNSVIHTLLNGVSHAAYSCPASVILM